MCVCLERETIETIGPTLEMARIDGGSAASVWFAWRHLHFLGTAVGENRVHFCLHSSRTGCPSDLNGSRRALTLGSEQLEDKNKWAGVTRAASRKRTKGSFLFPIFFFSLRFRSFRH